MSAKKRQGKKGKPEKLSGKKEYPFAKARVERILQKHCKNVEVAPRVRLAFNRWLGDMVEGVAKELAKVPHKTITEEDFKRVVSKYEFAGDLKKERERISKKMKALNDEVGKFKTQVDASIIHKEKEAQDLIFARVRDQYKQDYEEAVYVKEAPLPEPEVAVGAEPEVDVEAEPKVEANPEVEAKEKE